MTINTTYDMQQIAADEVSSSGENIVWIGQPNPFRLVLTSLPIILFGIPWTAFAIFWVMAASGFNFPDFSNPGFTTFFPLFGLPFVVIGIGMLLTPAFAYTRAFRTYYIITNKSARIVTLGKVKKVITYGATDLGEFERREKPDGSGDIIFKKNSAVNTNRNRTSSLIGFWGIQDVRAVEEHLLAIRKNNSP